MNNNIFHPARFGKLFVRNLKSNPKMWLQSALVFAGMPVLFLVLNAADFGINPTLWFRSNILELMIGASFVIAPFTHFFTYNHPKKGLPEVMLPASVAEKYLVMQVVCMLVAPLSIFVLWGGMDSLLALIFPKVYGGYAVASLFRSGLGLNSFLALLLLQQSIFLFNLLFVRRKILKTTGVYILATILLTALVTAILVIVVSETPFDDGQNRSISLSDIGLFDFSDISHPEEVVAMIFRIITLVVMPPLLMIASFFVMKTKRY